MVSNTPRFVEHGVWEVELSNGKTINENDIVRTDLSPWMIFKQSLAGTETKIVKMRIKLGELVSECPVKNAAAYYFARKCFGVINGGPSGNMAAHGYLDDSDNVNIIWCGANGYSYKEVRPKNRCEAWLI
jgi:hypothetical protein